ncbi:DUF4294 domain-containing protein [Mesohalobacter halotolerans]|uniref:DUF4294 domain-containing protein n=1 Tax=Mesohalobacter halotolerans TaxID=1883405 RepID=A0A4U5TR90_9FLAO|nr:DUF4294 domain-containing protein [Mesohalobacter halotolerans]MBS3737663.1 DUF4294 domain-containing protein [Psychroflexus sp.]TKS56596.1 DUF4294 domain-containing protein [Mesohalobacter halotolerans]
MKFTLFTFLICSSFIQVLHAQIKEYVPESKDKTAPKEMIIIEHDTLVVNEITLDEVIVFQPLRFESKSEYKTYLILKRKTRKVWPYAVLAAERLETLNARLEQLDSKRKKRRYTKRIQKYIEGKFTDRLKKLTKTEGQILVKLMHRQTGITTFDLVKELKSGWRAFWYNTTASLFNISLKEKYDPYSVKEDYLIEDILRRSFKDGVLDNHDPAFEIDYLDLVELWQNKKTEAQQAD